MILCGADIILIGIKYTRNVMCLNHPKTVPLNHWSVEKQSSMKLIPGTKKVWDCCLKGHQYLLDFYIQLNITLFSHLFFIPSLCQN